MAAVGNVQRLTYDITDDTGVPVNPTTAVLVIVKPDGTNVSPAPTITLPPAVTGHLVYDYVPADIGRFTGYWQTTSPATAKGFTFNVESLVSGALMSLADGKLYLNIPTTDTSNDREVSDFIDVVTAIVEDQIGPIIPRTVIERHDSGQKLALRTGPVISITSIQPWLVGSWGETVPVGDVRVDPRTWIVERRSMFPFFRGPYEVTFKAGRASIPATVIHAAKVILDHIWETQRGVSVVNPGPVSDDEIFSVSGRLWSVPKAALELLKPYEIGPSIG
jgi:hypothetical protein